jgi:hypothetical protein
MRLFGLLQNIETMSLEYVEIIFIQITSFKSKYILNRSPILATRLKIDNLK